MLSMWPTIYILSLKFHFILSLRKKGFAFQNIVLINNSFFIVFLKTDAFSSLYLQVIIQISLLVFKSALTLFLIALLFYGKSITEEAGSALTFRRWHICKAAKTPIFSIASPKDSILFHKIVCCHQKPQFFLTWKLLQLIPIFSSNLEVFSPKSC